MCIRTGVVANRKILHIKTKTSSPSLPQNLCGQTLNHCYSSNFDDLILISFTCSLFHGLIVKPEQSFKFSYVAKYLSNTWTVWNRICKCKLYRQFNKCLNQTHRAALHPQIRAVVSISERYSTGGGLSEEDCLTKRFWSLNWQIEPSKAASSVHKTANTWTITYFKEYNKKLQLWC